MVKKELQSKSHQIINKIILDTHGLDRYFFDYEHKYDLYNKINGLKTDPQTKSIKLVDLEKLFITFLSKAKKEQLEKTYHLIKDDIARAVGDFHFKDDKIVFSEFIPLKKIKEGFNLQLAFDFLIFVLENVRKCLQRINKGKKVIQKHSIEIFNLNKLLVKEGGGAVSPSLLNESVSEYSIHKSALILKNISSELDTMLLFNHFQDDPSIKALISYIDNGLRNISNKIHHQLSYSRPEQYKQRFFKLSKAYLHLCLELRNISIVIGIMRNLINDIEMNCQIFVIKFSLKFFHMNRQYDYKSIIDHHVSSIQFYINHNHDKKKSLATQKKIEQAYILDSGYHHTYSNDPYRVFHNIINKYSKENLFSTEKMIEEYIRYECCDKSDDKSANNNSRLLKSLIYQHIIDMVSFKSFNFVHQIKEHIQHCKKMNQPIVISHDMLSCFKKLHTDLHQISKSSTEIPFKHQDQTSQKSFIPFIQEQQKKISYSAKSDLKNDLDTIKAFIEYCNHNESSKDNIRSTTVENVFYLISTKKAFCFRLEPNETLSNEKEKSLMKIHDILTTY